jgi:hypothetical protein
MTTAYGAEDWQPEEGVGSDPLKMDTLEERWIEFYVARTSAQIERALSEEEI